MTGPRRRSWSLRQYMALFMVVLLTVAAAAAIAQRGLSEQDARQSAQADANFAARIAATEITNGLALLVETPANVAADPQIAAVLAAPTGPCSLTFTGASPFLTGHLDIITSDGTVKCSSQPLPSGPVYGSAGWLPAAISSPVTAAPFLDPVAGQISAIVASPVAGGLGTVVAIVALAPVGPNLSSTFGGARQLEFLVTTKNAETVLARSMDPARWVGAKLQGTTFATDPSSGIAHPDVDGTPRLYGRSAVGSTAWTVFAGADEAAALSAADLAANRGLTIILAGVSLMLVVVFLLYRRIARPIRRLSLVMRGSTPGPAVKSVSRRGAAEVTDLAEDFDELMVSVNRELADRISSEQSALVSERAYRTLFEGHPQPMWLYDVKTLAFLSVNDAAVERYGFTREEFLAMTIRDIRPPQDVAKLLEIEKQLPPIDKTGPWRHQLKDGTTIQVLVTSHAITFGDRDARFVLAEELADGQRLLVELHQSQARAESNAELSRAKDEMVSMVSHEMRTPLASIVGFTELLATREVTPEQRKEYLGVMLQEGNRLTALINDFLDLRRIEGGHLTMRFAPAELTALIKRAVELFSGDSRTAIETRLPHDLPLVRTDSDSIFRVLANLLSNALKYSPNGGSIVIGATAIDGMVEVYIQDEGLGIPADALPHLFRKFYRVDTADRRAIKGTGLGLAISKNIVEAHGGKIGASSPGPGKGSRFYFTVPTVREQAQKGDVLVVEDDSGFAHLLEAELAGRGLTSIWAADAETAEHLMTKRGARAVVLDLLLPGLQGEAFLQRLRNRHGTDIPVVVVTLKDLTPEESLSLQKAGVTAVLRKGPGMAEAAANLIAKTLALEAVAS